MRRAVALLAALAAPACAGVGLVERPPSEFQRGVSAIVMFSDDVTADCARFGMKTVPVVAKAVACEAPGSQTIVAPNPCRWPVYDPYAIMLCHELAHSNGWRHAPVPFVSTVTRAARGAP